MLTRDQLVRKALIVLEDASSPSNGAPAAKSLGLRFALAYLFSVSDGRREPFDEFWNEATRPVPPGANVEAAAIDRGQSTNACLNGIYRCVGVERTPDRIFYMTKKRRDRP